MAAAAPSHILDCGPQDRSIAGRLLSQEGDVPLQVQVAQFVTESEDTALNSTGGDNPDRDVSHQDVSTYPLATSVAMPSQSQRVDLQTQMLNLFMDFFPSTAITMDTPFADCGIDSKDLSSLSEKLGGTVGRSVEPTAFFDYPSVRAISDWLCFGTAAGEPATSSQDAEVPRHDESSVATPTAPR